MKAALLFLAALCLGITSAASAQATSPVKLSTGRDYLANCGQIDTDASDASPRQAIRDIACISYVTGVIDGIHAIRGPQSLEAVGICVSSSVTLVDLMKSVTLLIRSDDTYLDTKTNVVIYMTLLHSYPCR